MRGGQHVQCVRSVVQGGAANLKAEVVSLLGPGACRGSPGCRLPSGELAVVWRLVLYQDHLPPGSPLLPDHQRDLPPLAAGFVSVFLQTRWKGRVLYFFVLFWTIHRLYQT